jgi:hypothetical protein
LFLSRNSIYFQGGLNKIGKGTIFKNWHGLIFNRGIEKIEEDVIFQNSGDIIIREKIGSLSKGVKFNNGGAVGGKGLDEISIGGISNNRILNCMIKQLYGE